MKTAHISLNFFSWNVLSKYRYLKIENKSVLGPYQSTSSKKQKTFKYRICLLLNRLFSDSMQIKPNWYKIRPKVDWQVWYFFTTATTQKRGQEVKITLSPSTGDKLNVLRVSFSLFINFLFSTPSHEDNYLFLLQIWHRHRLSSDATNCF